MQNLSLHTEQSFIEILILGSSASLITYHHTEADPFVNKIIQLFVNDISRHIQTLSDAHIEMFYALCCVVDLRLFEQLLFEKCRMSRRLD